MTQRTRTESNSTQIYICKKWTLLLTCIPNKAVPSIKSLIRLSLSPTYHIFTPKVQKMFMKGYPIIIKESSIINNHGKASLMTRKYFPKDNQKHRST